MAKKQTKSTPPKRKHRKGNSALERKKARSEAAAKAWKTKRAKAKKQEERLSALLAQQREAEEQAAADAGTDVGAEPETSPSYARAWSHLENPRQRAFLTAYATNRGFVTKAAEVAGVDRRTHVRWLHDDEAYAEAFEEANHVAGDLLEFEADRRACQGLIKYQFSKDGDPLIHPITGEPYYEVAYSDTLLIKRLEARRPDLYRRKQLEVTGKDGGPIETADKSTTLRRLQDTTLRAVLADLASAEGGLP